MQTLCPSTGLAVLLVAIGGAGSICARAEPDSEAEAATIAFEIVAAINEAYDCRLGLLGPPKRDSFLGSWTVPFAAVGRQCDSAQDALSSQASDAGIQFMRRPSLSQLRALLAPMIRSAELASGCRIGLRGQPVLDEETLRWFVRVVGSGGNCAEAMRNLSRQAADIDTTILGTTERPLLDRVR